MYLCTYVGWARIVRMCAKELRTQSGNDMSSAGMVLMYMTTKVRNNTRKKKMKTILIPTIPYVHVGETALCLILYTYSALSARVTNFCFSFEKRNYKTDVIVHFCNTLSYAPVSKKRSQIRSNVYNRHINNSTIASVTERTISENGIENEKKGRGYTRSLGG